jgi:hypothetical protein
MFQLPIVYIRGVVRWSLPAGSGSKRIDELSTR